MSSFDPDNFGQPRSSIMPQKRGAGRMSVRLDESSAGMQSASLTQSVMDPGRRQAMRTSQNFELQSSIMNDQQNAKSKFLESVEKLPQTFDVKAIEKKRVPNTEYCMLCEDKFTMVKNPIRHCKMCAKSICNVCSLQKRQLCLQDTNKYRVCDECDTKLDNWEMQENHKEVINAQMQKIMALN